MLRGVNTLSALASHLMARLPTMSGEEQRLGLEVSPGDAAPIQD